MSENKTKSSLYDLIIIHYLTSAICFLLLAVMMMFSSDAFVGHYFQPRLLAITHMAALGWGTVIIFGASYQLVPYIMKTDLFSPGLAWLSYLLFIPGLAALVFSFWIFDPGIFMQAGSVLLLASVSIYVFNIFFTVRKNRQESIQEEFIVTSCWWLAFTAVLGTLMVFNFRFAFLPQDHLQFLRLHAHMGLVGWLLLLIIGWSSRLVPADPVSKSKLLSWSYYLINIALLLFLLDTYYSGINYKTLFITVIGAAGLGFYILYVFRCYRKRISRAINFPILNTVLSFVFLALAVLILPFLIFYHLNNDPLSIKYSMMYGILLFMGWLTSLILGQTFKTLPVMVWRERYRHLNEKNKAALSSNLTRSSLFRLQSGAFLIFCFSFFPGLIFSSEGLINLGLLSLFITAVVYLANIAWVLWYKTKAI